MITAWLLVAVGLVVLVGGAEFLVRGASGLAGRFGISPLVIGLTVVAFGTSSPEIAVSLSATFGGKPGLALGNAVGSNIFNVLFILGLTALIRPLLVDQKLVRIDVPIMIAASATLWLMLLDGTLGRLDGAILFTGIVLYVGFAIRLSRRESKAIRDEYASAMPRAPRRSVVTPTALVLVGLVAEVIGARWLVAGSVTIATSLGVSEVIIGLTIVAAGTSLPELATSLVAAVRGQRDIAVGNIIGSNLFNILAIIGLTGLLAPEPMAAPASLVAFDVPAMVIIGVACLPIAFTGSEIRRWEGALLFAGYLAYLACLLLDASGHHAVLNVLKEVLRFALPVAAVGIVVSVVASLRPARRRGSR